MSYLPKTAENRQKSSIEHLNLLPIKGSSEKEGEYFLWFSKSGTWTFSIFEKGGNDFFRCLKGGLRHFRDF